MVTTGFGICLVISVAMTLVMGFRNNERIDSYTWSIAILLPFLIMGYWLKTQVNSPQAAMVLFCFINLGTSVLLAVVLFSMLVNLNIPILPVMKAIVYAAAFAQLLPVWIMFERGIPGDMIVITDTGDGYATRLQMGAFAFAHYAFILAAVILAVGAFSILRAPKKTYSRRTMAIYMLLVGAGIALYAAEAILDTDFSMLPYLYMAGDALVTMNYDRAHLYDIYNVISESQRLNTNRGYAAVATSGVFLSANERCFDLLPELRNQRADTRIPADSGAGRLLYGMIEGYRNEGTTVSEFRNGDMICVCRISRIAMGGRRTQGYLFDIRDATEEKRNLQILSSYNEQLNREVEEKTRNIETIQHKIVLGMADMVENRDSNTGGHIKRTSDVIQILVEEIQKLHTIPLDEELARDIVRAAPMHDLGKVSIDSGVLNKPGKLTPEEYAIMKSHSTISGQMVKILLEGVEQEHFVRTAYHVARYHHERWDGKGYPEGLVGEMIPLEARIMAVADVYDALVSKRIYKEPMSFEQAAQIMEDGMGTQFDPNMRAVFRNCRPVLEHYYSFV